MYAGTDAYFVDSHSVSQVQSHRPAFCRRGPWRIGKRAGSEYVVVHGNHLTVGAHPVTAVFLPAQSHTTVSKSCAFISVCRARRQRHCRKSLPFSMQTAFDWFHQLQPDRLSRPFRLLLGGSYDLPCPNHGLLRRKTALRASFADNCQHVSFAVMPGAARLDFNFHGLHATCFPGFALPAVFNGKCRYLKRPVRQTPWWR